MAEGQNISFKDVAMSVHQLNAPSYRNTKYAAQWLSSLENHAFAVIGSKAIGSITSADILSVLSPIWVEKNDTAKKIRQRLSQIMKWAKAQGYYSGDNPVELAEHALPKISKVDSHHAALAFSELPDMVQRLSKTRSLSQHGSWIEIYPEYQFRIYSRQPLLEVIIKIKNIASANPSDDRGPRAAARPHLTPTP